jgi:hypothetical protein
LEWRIFFAYVFLGILALAGLWLLIELFKDGKGIIAGAIIVLGIIAFAAYFTVQEKLRETRILEIVDASNARKDIQKAKEELLSFSKENFVNMPQQFWEELESVVSVEALYNSQMKAFKKHFSYKDTKALWQLNKIGNGNRRTKILKNNPTLGEKSMNFKYAERYVFQEYTRDFINNMESFLSKWGDSMDFSAAEQKYIIGGLRTSLYSP